MPIINLRLHGKQTIGDGTKIVCMNGDYQVRISCVDCEDFISMPVKKLILKMGTDYYETDLAEVEIAGKTFYQAELPIVESQKSVELGVCGKPSEDAYPEYTSKPALFECEKSILCGTVVLRSDPKLDVLEVRENGTFLASEKKVDGFYQVNVAVGATPTEERIVELSMAGGSQVVIPTSIDKAMRKVTITKPIALVPENVRKGFEIGGVVGTYDKVLTETEVYTDGEYLPPEGADGFSKVIVRVSNSNYNKLLRIGQSFEYIYDTAVSITMDTPGIVKYENSGEAIIFTAINKGTCSVVVKDLDDESKVINTVHYAIVVELENDYLMPTEAADPIEMDLYLKECAVGGVVKYTGPTIEGFVKNALYIIESEGQ